MSKMSKMSMMSTFSTSRRGRPRGRFGEGRTDLRHIPRKLAHHAHFAHFAHPVRWPKLGGVVTVPSSSLSSLSFDLRNEREEWGRGVHRTTGVSAHDESPAAAAARRRAARSTAGGGDPWSAGGLGARPVGGRRRSAGGRGGRRDRHGRRGRRRRARGRVRESVCRSGRLGTGVVIVGHGGVGVAPRVRVGP